MRDKSHGNIVDNFSQTWGHSLNRSGTVPVDDCPVSQKAILYAMGELGPADVLEITGHIHKCRFCLDLILDLRTAQDESRQTAGQLVEVLPALADAIGKPDAEMKSASLPAKILASISNFCSYFVRPKIIVGLASACLALIIIRSGLNDSDTSQSYQVIQNRIEAPTQKASKPAKPQPRASEKTPPANDVSTKTQNKPAKKETVYKAIPVHKYEKVVPSAKQKTKKRIAQTALQRMDLIQFRLVGIVFSPEGNTAMLEDSTGKGYLIKEGTYIGKNSGKVVQIKKDRIIIEEQIQDSSGDIKLHKIELKLHNKS